MADASPRGEMPFLDHLEELRWRILWSLLAIAIGTAVGWLIVDRIDVITVLKRPIAPFLRDGRLSFTSPTEPLLLTLKVAFAAGCLLASPVVIYQIWAFLAPALYEREKRLIVPALAVGVILFLLGATAAYLWALPAALEVLFGFMRTDLDPVITIDRYFGFAIPFILAFGVVTELPLVVSILAALGLVTPQFLARHRRYAIVGAAVLAALLTPPDAVSMMMMLVPLLLLYEVSIWCAWVASRRRARREAATGAGAAVLVWLLLGAGSLHAQDRPPGDTVPPQSLPGRAVDTATARKLGLPTGPTRTFPPSDRVIDSLLKLQGYRVTRYGADTVVMQGDSQIVFLRHEALVEREGTQLEADSIRYQEASCRLDAGGEPRLFDQGTVLVGEGMRYDTCLRRGTVRDALTDFQQGGVTWYVRGQLGVDSGSTRGFGGDATFTSDPQPVPDYHFAAGQMKWISKNVMVARPAVLYVRDVPVMWLPFIFQDIRSGRRSGILVPHFGLNDLVRTSRTQRRQVTGLGYYFVINDYVDLLVSGDWHAGTSVSFRAQAQYRWLDRFVQGGVSYTNTQELDTPLASSHITWNHAQRFDSRTDFNASVNYSTRASVLARNSLNPLVAIATLASSASFNKRFSWGTLNVGARRSQELSNDRVTQTFPDIRLTPAAVNLGSLLTWSPGFSFTNEQSFHNAYGTLPIPGDSAPLFYDDRQTRVSFQTPLRIGRWNWANSVDVLDVVSSRRQEFVIDDRRVLYAQTFRTDVNWQTGINLPSLFTGTWRLQPGISIANRTGAGPFMLRNQFSGGKFVTQGKRLAFSASLSPTFFGFFPGLGPLERIRHAVSPSLSYQYAPGSKVPEEYARAIDPTGSTFNARSDPQQTISLSLTQTFDAKLRAPARASRGDTASAPEVRKIKLLGISTSAIGYNFEQAKIPGRTGWQTASLSNTITSDLLPGNFSISVSHDLWRGRVGTDSAKLDPFLTSISTQAVNVTSGTLRAIGGLLGLGLGVARPAAPPPADTAGAQGNLGALGQQPGATQSQLSSPLAGTGFRMTLGFSIRRTRPGPTPTPRGGQQTVTMATAFSPTRNWALSWNTIYDLQTRQFGYHAVNLERNLHRWHASFAFNQAANGNFSFSFTIRLTDQPDIKFDYDQRTWVR